MNQRKGPANVGDAEYVTILMASEESNEFQEGQPDEARLAKARAFTRDTMNNMMK
jgi:hypothetical protein